MADIKPTPLVAGDNELLNPLKILEKLELKPGMKVGDFGCGRVGHFVFPAAKIVKNSGLVYAVDVLKPVLTAIEGMAKIEKIRNIKTVWSNIEIFKATKIEDNHLDAGFLVNILFQIKNPIDAIEEAARMIKLGGKMLVVDWSAIESPMGPALDQKIKKEKVEEIMVGLKMQKIDDFEAGSYHYGMIFKK